MINYVEVRAIPILSRDRNSTVSRGHVFSAIAQGKRQECAQGFAACKMSKAPADIFGHRIEKIPHPVRSAQSSSIPLS